MSRCIARNDKITDQVDWPLDRTGRAAFPHPAPCEANASAVVVDIDIYSGMGQREFLQKVIEPIPIVALSLVSPVQPEEQAPAYFVAEIVQAVEVVSYPVVRK